jgi:rhamnogalacturonan endolyase
VDDKYQYSSKTENNKVHGWISNDPPVGFWIITPSNEFRIAGPNKQELTSHAGPIALSVSPLIYHLTINYIFVLLEYFILF